MTNIVSDAQWRAALNAIGAEDFETGYAEPLRLRFRRESLDSSGTLIPSKGRRVRGRCVEADAVLHGLVKQSVITRVADGSKWTIREISPDGSGMMEVVLGA